MVCVALLLCYSSSHMDWLCVVPGDVSGDGVPGVQPSVVDVGGRGRVSEGPGWSQAGNERVLNEAVPPD